MTPHWRHGRALRESVRAISGTKSAVTIYLSDEAVANLNRLKEIWSHVNSQQTNSDVFERVLAEMAERVDPLKRAERIRNRKTKQSSKPFAVLNALPGKNERSQKSVLEFEAGMSSLNSLDPLDKFEFEPVLNSNLLGSSRQKVSLFSESKIETKSKSEFESESRPESESNSRSNLNSISKLQSIDQTPAPKFEPNNCQQARKQRSRYIPSLVRREVWRRDSGRCTHVDLITGRLCESTRFLQFDHIVAFALGGQNTVESLRLRCVTHNGLHAAKTFGRWWSPQNLHEVGSGRRQDWSEQLAIGPDMQEPTSQTSASMTN